jgi:hypothetical protein
MYKTLSLIPSIAKEKKGGGEVKVFRAVSD